MAKSDRKVLIAHGTAGSYEVAESQHWNWCQEREPVWTHGMRCCRSLECGCGISFVGLYSNLATTRAEVAELDAVAFRHMLQQFRESYMLAWPDHEKKFYDAVVAFIEEMPHHLATLPVGTIVCLEKLGEGEEFQLIPQTCPR